MTNSPRRKILLVILILVGLSSLLAAGYLFAQEEYAIYDGADSVVSVSGNFGTVADVVKAAGLELRAEDVVRPPPDEPARADVAIQIQRARAITVKTEATTRTHFTHQPTIYSFLEEIGQLPQRTTQLYADGVKVPFNTWATRPLPQLLEIGRFLTVTIEDAGLQQTMRTGEQTVGDVLNEVGITLFAADGVEPEPGTWLEPDMTIQVLRSKPLTIQVDGQTITTRSHFSNALDVVAAAGITLVGFDYAVPGPERTLLPNDVIAVVRVTEDFRLEDEPIPFQTVWQASDQLDIDSQALVSAGVPGLKRKRIRVRYEDGVPAGETVDGEWIAREPTNEVIGYGTNIVIRSVDTPEGPLEYWRVVRMRVTAYTPASAGKPPDAPGYGVTASGLQAGQGVVAIDRNVVPWKSWLYVPGYGKAIAGDTGGGVRGRWIDLGYEDGKLVRWSGYVDVYYLTPVPPPADINYILPAGLP